MRERKFRVPSSEFRTGAALFALSLFIRCIGLQWGLPSASHWYSYHPDELQIYGAVASLDFFGGDFNPDFFNYPSLYIYFAYFAHGVLAVLGLAHPFPQDQSQVWMLMHDILLSARVVTAVLGAATAPLVFLIARQIGGAKIGILAALLLAFAPGHVQHSHFATVDVPATFFAALCLWLSTHALQDEANPKRQRVSLLLAAFVAGLAAATKYNAVILVIAPLAAWFFLWRQNTVNHVLPLALIALCLLGFFIGCPFSVFDFPHFWGDGKNAGFAYELLVHPRQGHGGVFTNTGNGWVYHLFFNAPFLMTAPLLIASLFGMICTRFPKKAVQRFVMSVLLIWCALYYCSLGFSQVRFMRYLLPLVPALCVFAALGVLSLHKRRTKTAASAVLIFIAAWGTCDVLYPFVVEDPRDAVAKWLAKKASTPITVGMIEAPWYYSPPLSPLDSPPFRRLSPEQLFQLSGKKYRFVITGLDVDLLEPKTPFVQTPPWFVISEYEWREEERLNDPQWRAFKETLKSIYILERRFKNDSPLTFFERTHTIREFTGDWPLELPGRTFVPHDFLYANPDVRIYRVPDPNEEVIRF